MATKGQPGDSRGVAVADLLQSGEFRNLRTLVEDMRKHVLDSEDRWRTAVLDSLKSPTGDSASLVSILGGCFRASQGLLDRWERELTQTRIICASSVLCAVLTSTISELGRAGDPRRKNLVDQQRAAAGKMIQEMGGASRTLLSPEERRYNDQDLGALYHPLRDLFLLWYSLANDEQGAFVDCLAAPTAP